MIDLRKFIQEVSPNSPLPVQIPTDTKEERERQDREKLVAHLDRYFEDVQRREAEREKEKQRFLQQRAAEIKEGDYDVEWGADPGYALLRSADAFEMAWDLLVKGEFHGYTQSSISERPYRQAANKAWAQSRKVKRGRTRARYARNKTRGTVRPAMRRQLGAGGSRFTTKR